MRRLDGVVREYDWGDAEAIPALLGVPASGRPQAELWMGAHPSAPSTVDGEALDARIAADPVGCLGADYARRFQTLPMLFKILAAAKPLSIQVHPSREQAVAGFARENAAGIALDSPVRTYRDTNHKPELICALTTFTAKCGFRFPSATVALLDALGCEALAPIRQILDQANRTERDDRSCLAEALAFILGLDPDVGTALVAATVAAAAQALKISEAHDAKWRSEFSAVAAMQRSFPNDVGIVVGLLLNHVELQPGEALFLEAGNLHSYLGGVGVELMATSDNVVRGGLTPKHIDVDELCRVVDCSPIDPPIQRPAGPMHLFDIPVDEFALARFDLAALANQGAPTIEGPAILLATSGQAQISADVLTAGQAAFIAACDGPQTLQGSGVLWAACVDDTQVRQVA